jgi:hypothetical protein
MPPSSWSGISRRTAFVPGLIFAFYPYHLTRSLEHLFLVTGTACLPLYILCLLKALREGGATNALLAAVVFLMTMLSNLYYRNLPTPLHRA